jgi:hypothetical protein
LAKELKPNRKLFPDHLSFILHGALVVAGSLWAEGRRRGGGGSPQHLKPDT